MASYLEKAPPAATGNVQADIQSILNYLAYCKEQTNFILSQLYRRQLAQERSAREDDGITKL